MNVMRIAAFCHGDKGGNPAGVVISEQLPDEHTMQQVARDVGYSETAFAAPQRDGWRVRYFAPESEVPFCGHATIALGAALAKRFGQGCFKLMLNNNAISVEGRMDGDLLQATLESAPTHSEVANSSLVDTALALFQLPVTSLDARLPPAIIDAGARHLLLALDSRARLSALAYDFDVGRKLMTDTGLITIAVVFPESAQRFHARNAFASGGVYEDPATGAAAAALGGYLRLLSWPHGGAIEVMQGEDMGMPSRISVEIPPAPANRVRVSGRARLLQ